MGKKRITESAIPEAEGIEKTQAKSSRKSCVSGVLNIQSTYNNTKLMLADAKGNALCWSSSGQLGFKGAKKGTPFAASKIGEIISEKASALGMKEVVVVIKGVVAGRESALRSFSARGISIRSISDVTPIPHNGPRPPKPRRV